MLTRPALSLLLVTIACAGDPEPPLTQLQLGERLFTEETFEGNGRVCSTCHELGQFGTITPEWVQARWAADPSDVLFRAIDSDDGLGRTYERLLTHATVRVPMPLPADPATGLAVRRCDAPADTLIVLNRGNPTVFNAGLELNLMVDGREAGELARQAHNAVRTHNEPRRDATPEEAEAIAAFQRSLYSRTGLVGFPRADVQLNMPEPTTLSEARGLSFLAPVRPCGICHSGPLFNRTSFAHPDAIGADFESSLVGQEPDNPNPKYDWCFVDPERNEVVPGPNGSERVFERPTADPGMAILPGARAFVTADDRLESASNQELATLVGPAFKIPTLWGVANTAPYFHDNSAKTLEDVVDQYNFFYRTFPDFAGDAGCRPAPEDCLSAQDQADIVAYLRLLTFEGSGLRVPDPATRLDAP